MSAISAVRTTGALAASIGLDCCAYQPSSAPLPRVTLSASTQSAIASSDAAGNPRRANRRSKRARSAVTSTSVLTRVLTFKSPCASTMRPSTEPFSRRVAGRRSAHGSVTLAIVIAREDIGGGYRPRNVVELRPVQRFDRAIPQAIADPLSRDARLDGKLRSRAGEIERAVAKGVGGQCEPGRLDVCSHARGPGYR